jgi:hypothetical protein
MAAIAHVSEPGISYSDIAKPAGLMQMRKVSAQIRFLPNG